MFLQQWHRTGKATRHVVQVSFIRLIGALTLISIAPHQLAAQNDLAGQWPQYRGNFSGTGYSELSAISPEIAAAATISGLISIVLPVGLP